MSIKFKKLKVNDISDFELITKWDNQEDIKYFIRPNFIEGEIEDMTVETLLLGFKSSFNRRIYIISCDNKKIGYISIDSNFLEFYNDEPDSAWISICIGEKDYRGRGIAKYAMKFLEKKCRELNKTRIELGVFDYNKRAIAFYKKMGYRKIGENKDFVYYNGKWHNDIRMEKYIK